MACRRGAPRPSRRGSRSSSRGLAGTCSHVSWERGQAARAPGPGSPQTPHAAAPHPDGMNIRLFLGGRSPPRPPRGWGDGETGFPHPPARGLRPPRPSRGWGDGETGFPHPPAQGLRSPKPSCGWGDGETGFPHPPARGLRPPRPSHRWGDGETGFPHPPCARATPSQTLLRVGGWGNPVSPCPCGAGAWGNRVSPGRGYGGTWFPHVHVSTTRSRVTLSRNSSSTWAPLPGPSGTLRVLSGLSAKGLRTTSRRK